MPDMLFGALGEFSILFFSQGLVQNDVQDPDEFTLTLHVRVPPTRSEERRVGKECSS